MAFWILPQPKPQRWRSEKYLDFIRNKPCIFGCITVPDDTGKKSEPHHLRELFQTGFGTKPGDHLAIPVCRKCHDLCQEHRHPRFESFDMKVEVIALITEYLCLNNIK